MLRSETTYGLVLRQLRTDDRGTLTFLSIEAELNPSLADSSDPKERC